MTAYDRTLLRARWLHIGFGAFARAHPLFVLHRGMATGAQPDWGVIVARLNSGQAELQALDAADHLYHVLGADADGLSATQVGCVIGTLHLARDGADAVPDRIASADLSVISLTITEKGYCLGTDGLDMNHPGIKADLSNPGTPRTAIGVLVQGLARRKAAGLGGLTLLACDNLPENGRKLARAVQDYALATDADLACWIKAQCRFPCSMVDRIVPAMTDAAHAQVTQHLGHPDPAAVMCEPFLQWVIEDDFAQARPPLAEGGAILVDDVLPYEDAKLRMLNGAHTFLALLGRHMGIMTIDACMQDPDLADALLRFHTSEAAPTLPQGTGIDLAAYGAALRARFTNPRLQHRTEQIASDTSLKLPQRILAPLRWHLDNHGAVPPLMALTLASWLTWLIGHDDDGRPLPLNDAAAAPLQARLADLPAGENPVAAMLAWRNVFPEAIGQDPRVQAAVADLFDRITRDGARATLHTLMSKAMT
jgi:fructuronate reductase